MRLVPIMMLALSTLAVACTAGGADPEIDAETTTMAADGSAESGAQQADETGYSADWNKVPYWTGEYPNGAAITAADVTVMAHEKLHRESPATIACPLPHKAVYSPWNAARGESDGLEFITMTYPTKVEIKDAIDLEVFQGDTPVTLSLQAGDTLKYENYLAEGWFIATLDGLRYELNETDLPQTTVFEQGPEDDEWLYLTCADADATAS